MNTLEEILRPREDNVEKLAQILSANEFIENEIVSKFYWMSKFSRFFPENSMNRFIEAV